MPTLSSRRGSGLILIIGFAWLFLAIVLGASGRLQALHPPGPQIVLFGLTAAVLIALTRPAPARRWVNSLPLRALVVLHLTRFAAGADFLRLYARGELPRAFAVPCGWGDILVSVLAAGLLLGGSPSTPGRNRLYLLWNLLGLTDILFVVATATRLGIANPGSMQALLRLPLSLLPTFLVPLIIASHALMILRLRGRLESASPR
ncbi:MAG TPA: hypothetical protein VEU07_05560 [Candidatus Acidoferrum sp.]|nr:hypothetical protein [Candidatus Acidoferrum sp.]